MKGLGIGELNWNCISINPHLPLKKSQLANQLINYENIHAVVMRMQVLPSEAAVPQCYAERIFFFFYMNFLLQCINSKLQNYINISVISALLADMQFPSSWDFPLSTFSQLCELRVIMQVVFFPLLFYSWEKVSRKNCKVLQLLQ